MDKAEPELVDGRRLRMLEAAYLRSGPNDAALGASLGPEVAFVGRSNVGKSSLLNALLGTALARVSKTPGRTRLVNLFTVQVGKVARTSGLVGEKRRVVLADLPGYGFAKLSKAEADKLDAVISGYLSERRALALVVHLFDARHEPSRQDVAVHRELQQLDVPRVYVATKADKLKPAERGAVASRLARALAVDRGVVLPFSCQTGQGRDALWARLWQVAV
ncbi:MAG: ribosome biogenesis GTP-binding protein YsxC [Deltaproteobacteria bacterium RBG_16_71_12]|nr:MAG: ribosome biogenesis GTP-binding protein YsxC [Deltaproteobacteria bacterium RBG_16_71_12]